ncbi:MAG: DNA-binding transcriptional regulator [Kiritimatiellae bacterium]|nr:DNA-binding transcriptional regulator [Kiritimatiellia bacterium]
MKNVLLQLGYSSHRKLEAIAEFAKAHGWAIAFEDSSVLPQGWRGDGVLMNLRARRPQLAYFAQKLAARGIPVVDLSISRPELPFPRVVGDHRAIGVLAAEHLAERHFRHAAFFAKDWTNVERLRLEGFSENWPEEKPLALVWRNECGAGEYDDWPALDAWLAEKLRAAPKPLALFAFNDSQAARVLNVALSAGISVPEELAILGVDDESIIVENQSIPLSSVRHDLRRLGRESAALLDRLMNGGAAPAKPILIPPAGVSIRRSTDIVAAPTKELRKALTLVAQHIADDYGTKELAMDMGVSRATLCRMFSKGIGTTPSRELLRQRLGRAKAMLGQGDAPIKAIAAECGFWDSAHLTNAFRIATGTTPKEYRLRAQAADGGAIAVSQQVKS